MFKRRKKNKIQDKNKKEKNRLSPLEQINGKLPTLHTGDIVLIRHKRGGILRFLLRKVLNCYFDHSAMVIYGRKPQEGYFHDIIAESIVRKLAITRVRGVSIHRLNKYLYNPRKYDIGIKRVTGLSKQTKEHLRWYLLGNVDAPYWYLSEFKLFMAWIFKKYRTKFLRRQRYSCSGLIQKTYFAALPRNMISKVVFKQGDFSPIEIEELTSPADLAKSPNCEWIYNKHECYE